MSNVETITEEKPEVLGGVVPYLMIDGAVKAAEFYKEAFAAEEVARHPVDDQGRTMHIHLYIHGGSLMLSDPYPEYGCPAEKHQGYSLTLAVDDVDGWWARAIGAGVKVVVPLEKMFWGDRYGEVRDPFGVKWAIVGD
ncbi:glyoxalase/bleomycin resistance/extradiol dioxygenase family protein [Nitratireductor sp. ZSWI3]|uniref:VOC family protein n=1 Tax=Nitratireductor sp. ZSWI3 TaxID=2966359 RepID=UPI00214FFCA9|nr:glyoxalase/bleomycin resistance/extradiol dioxygenase family protein [Nitratireductor sp. ZSWI3]MCR4267879.1 glyoxalase/bleomycin resistance/extradiol dioxygenase family protein [Nitratireductor sp. ZSWI3]